MQTYLHSARLAARLGADIAAKYWGRHIGIREKAPADLVTQADLEIEAALVDFIRQRHPGHAVLAEEGHGGYELLNQAQIPVWVIDPLDGTTNFIHGWPMAAVSVAVVKNGQPLAGVVRHALYDEEFWAIKDGGAWLNGQPIQVSACAALNQSLCATAFPFRQRQLMPAYMKLFEQMFAQVEDVRRGGSAALDLAYVAAGRVDAYWETGLKPWDIAAGLLLVLEAGGIVSDFKGTDIDRLRGDADILAANGHLHTQLREFTAAWARKNL